MKIKIKRQKLREAAAANTLSLGASALPRLTRCMCVCMCDVGRPKCSLCTQDEIKRQKSAAFGSNLLTSGTQKKTSPERAAFTTQLSHIFQLKTIKPLKMLKIITLP